MTEIIIVIIIIIVFYFYSGGNMNIGVGIQLFAQAIANAEGFYVNGSIPQRANNPGDLTKGDYGDTGNYITASGGIQIIQYASPQDGWNALYTKLQNIADGNSGPYNLMGTLSQFAGTYSGSSDGTWLNNVISFLNQNGFNISSTNSVNDILNS